MTEEKHAMDMSAELCRRLVGWEDGVWGVVYGIKKILIHANADAIYRLKVDIGYTYKGVPVSYIQEDIAPDYAIGLKKFVPAGE